MHNILLVEYEPDVQFSNKVYLELNGGYNVRLAMNLAQARQRIAETAPDLIVLDIMLPDGSGLSFLKELREENVSIPILLLSELSEASDEVKCIQEGGDDYIAKPYENDVLLIRIQSLLR